MEGMDQFTGWFQSSLLTSVALQDSAPYKYVCMNHNDILLKIIVISCFNFHYRDLFVHGFAVDENNNKMSKSLGNVVNPEEITKGGKDTNKKPAYGVDVLRYFLLNTINFTSPKDNKDTNIFSFRWWVASHGTQHTLVPMKSTLLQGSADTINKLRNVFRFLLGALHTYNDKKNINVEPQYHYLDRYMLHQLYQYCQEVKKKYSEGVR